MAIPARQETTTTIATTMPAMAPEERWEDDLEAWSLLDGLDSGRDEPVAVGLVDGLDISGDEEVVASAPGQRMGSRLWEMGIPLEGIVDEALEMLLRGVALRLLEDVEEDSTALASAIETFAFALAKLVTQTLIWFLVCVQRSYSWWQHHSIMVPNFSRNPVQGGDGDYLPAPSLEHDICPGPGAPEEPPVQLVEKLQQELRFKHDVSSLE